MGMGRQAREATPRSLSQQVESPLDWSLFAFPPDGLVALCSGTASCHTRRRGDGSKSPGLDNVWCALPGAQGMCQCG